MRFEVSNLESVGMPFQGLNSAAPPPSWKCSAGFRGLMLTWLDSCRKI